MIFLSLTPSVVSVRSLGACIGLRMSASSGCGIRTASFGISVGSTCIPEIDPHCMSRSVFRVEGGGRDQNRFFLFFFFKNFFFSSFISLFSYFFVLFFSHVFLESFFWLR